MSRDTGQWRATKQHRVTSDCLTGRLGTLEGKMRRVMWAGWGRRETDRLLEGRIRRVMWAGWGEGRQTDRLLEGRIRRVMWAGWGEGRQTDYLRGGSGG